MIVPTIDSTIFFEVNKNFRGFTMHFKNEILENLKNDKRNDKFSFIVNSIIYKVPLSYALGMSRKICQLYLQDPSLKEYYINIEDNNKNFEKLYKGESVESEFIYKIGIILDNEKMINLYKKQNALTKENVNKRIKITKEIMKRYSESDINVINFHKEELNYIGENLEKMKDEIDQLTNEEIIYILKKTNIKIEKEEIILNIIKTRLQKIKDIKDIRENKLRKRNERKELIECINSQYLTRKSLKEFIKMIEEEDIKGELWNDIQKLFINNLEIIEENQIQEEEQKRKEEEQKRKEEEQKRKEEERKIWNQYYFNGNDYFNGIFNYLERKYGKDLLGNKIINLTASSLYSDNYPIQNIVDFTNNNEFCTQNEPNQWLQIDMMNHPVKLNGYSIQSNKGDNRVYLKSWVIEGSIDGNNWKEIDRRLNSNDLNDRYKVNYFRISNNTQSFRYIRLRVIDKTHHDDYYLYISKLELFGDLNESNE